MIKLVFTILMIFTFIIDSIPKQIYVIYGIQREQLELFKFFYDKVDGHYIDIGAYDPIMYSNTIYLYGKGWKGLNFEANPTRAGRFNFAKIKDGNYNFALGEQNKIVTLYEDKGDASRSSVSQKVAKQRKFEKNQNIIQKIQVSSISMKQVCQRFSTKKPNFLNLDVQGYDYHVLVSNDWKNTKCRPQIIIVQYNYLWQVTKFGDPKTLLQGYGYKFFKQFQTNSFFIEEKLFDQYVAKYKKGQQYLNQFDLVTFAKISEALGQYFDQPQYKNPLKIDNKEDPLYFSYPQQGEIINLLQINAQSNKISENQNRPIIIIQMNPSNNAVYLPNQKIQKAKIEIGEFSFFTFNIPNEDNCYFMVYILDLKWENNSEIKYLYRDMIYEKDKQILSTQQNPNKVKIQVQNQNQKQFNGEAQIQKYRNCYVNKIKRENQQKEFKQFLTILSEHHNWETQMKVQIILILQIFFIISLIVVGVFYKFCIKKYNKNCKVNINQNKIESQSTHQI